MALPAEADIPRILGRIRPNAEWGWMGGAHNDPAQIVWRDAVQVEPTLPELEAEWTVIVSEDAASETTRQALKTAYLPLVGRPYSDLSSAELRLMSESHSYILGGIDDKTRLLLPANQWGAAKRILNAT